MKKIFKTLTLIWLILSAVGFSSCSSDEPDLPKRKTTYNITSNIDVSKLDVPANVTTKTNISILEYNEANEIINIQDWRWVLSGSSRGFQPNEQAVKIVIHIAVEVTNGNNTSTLDRYVAQVYYLKPNDVIYIHIDGNTFVTNYNPLS